ncbi:MAG: class I SAM-dependent methyltransferase [Candidatus Thorarchaeota archaeon]
MTDGFFIDEQFCSYMSDPWSEIMRDAVNGVKEEYYIEREDGRIESNRVEDYLKSLLEWNELERLGIQHAKGKVLDIGCGAGRVLVHLKNLGHEVVGIDLALGAVEACRKRGIKNVFQMSAGNLEFPDGEFETIVMYGNNFGVLGDDDSIIKMLQLFHRITKDNGIIIAGSADVVKTDMKVHLEYHQMNVERNRPKGLVRLRVKYKDLVGDWVDLRLASPEEMEYLAEQSGWKLERKYQNGVPYVGVLVKS